MSLSYEEQREREREYKRRYREKYPEKRREEYRKNREAILAKAKARYQPKRAAVPDEWGSRRADRPQPDFCEVCNAGNRRLVWDHCHKRDKFRGWLCDQCNMLLGFAHDDPEYLRKLIAYLERTSTG